MEGAEIREAELRKELEELKKQHKELIERLKNQVRRDSQLDGFTSVTMQFTFNTAHNSSQNERRGSVSGSNNNTAENGKKK